MPKKPRLILVMRHAEKPLDPKDPNLSAAGRTRAEALASYIPETFGQPDFIFAAAISRHSERSIQTVRPIAATTLVPIQASIPDEAFATLANELLSSDAYAAKRAIVCWHHGLIPSMMRELGADTGDYPDPWDPDVFNLILKIEFDREKTLVTRVVEPF